MHGLFGSKKNFNSISQKLNNNLKRKIYAVDARNHGDSPHTPNHNSALLGDDVVQFFHKHDLKTASIIGMRYILNFVPTTFSYFFS